MLEISKNWDQDQETISAAILSKTDKSSALISKVPTWDTLISTESATSIFVKFKIGSSLTFQQTVNHHYASLQMPETDPTCSNWDKVTWIKPKIISMNSRRHRDGIEN